MIFAQVRAVAEDIGVDAVKIGMLGHGGDRRRCASRRSAWSARRRGGRPGDGRRERRDVARRRGARRACRAAAAAGRGGDAEHPRGGALAGLGERATRRSWRGRCWRSARGPLSSPAATARACDLFCDGQRVVQITGERHPDGASHGSGCTHSSALAAFLRPRSSRSRRRGGLAEWPQRRSPTACATSGRARAGRRLGLASKRPQ